VFLSLNSLSQKVGYNDLIGTTWFDNTLYNFTGIKSVCSYVDSTHLISWTWTNSFPKKDTVYSTYLLDFSKDETMLIVKNKNGTLYSLLKRIDSTGLKEQSNYNMTIPDKWEKETLVNTHHLSLEH